MGHGPARPARLLDRPRPATPPDAEHGRGLPLVRARADSWGASVFRELGTSKGGKLMWAECGAGAVAW
ncbi:hypothetical protein [Streptomyces sp.]|uniref:hypothetical protein n=1 Tax=Streptomyces sp. TaxID=1931 RepID=UPI00345334EE